jgi:hypothetical protein
MKSLVFLFAAGASLAVLPAGPALAGVTAIPEPTSFALIAAGAAAVAWAKFRKH